MCRVACICLFNWTRNSRHRQAHSPRSLVLDLLSLSSWPSRQNKTLLWFSRSFRCFTPVTLADFSLAQTCQHARAYFVLLAAWSSFSRKDPERWPHLGHPGTHNQSKPPMLVGQRSAACRRIRKQRHICGAIAAKKAPVQCRSSEARPDLFRSQLILLHHYIQTYPSHGHPMAPAFSRGYHGALARSANSHPRWRRRRPAAQSNWQRWPQLEGVVSCKLQAQAWSKLLHSKVHKGRTSGHRRPKAWNAWKTGVRTWMYLNHWIILNLSWHLFSS